MRTFILKIAKFLIILLLLYLPMFIFLLLSGENFYNIDQTLKSKNKYFIGYSHNEENYSYIKWKTIISKDKYEVWALGSSRVLQLRENMFTSSFYNAGYTVYSIGDYEQFLKSIPNDKYPEVLIIGFDQWMFNKNYDKLENTRNISYWKNSFVYFPKGSTYNAIASNFFSGKYNSFLNQINYDNNDVKKIGLNAIINNTGFRNDGSLFYGTQIKNLLRHSAATKDFEYRNTFKRIKKGNKKFQYGEVVNKLAVRKLEKLLKFCSDNKISVIGFLPPFAEKVNIRMRETAKYKYVEKIYPEIYPFFKKFNFELYDLTSPLNFNSNDNETIDGFHGGELMYLKALVYMANKNSKIKNHINIENLEKDIFNKQNRYLIYKN